MCYGLGSAPDPAGKAHDAPPDPIVSWGGGHPLPKNPTPVSAFSSVYPPIFLAIPHWEQGRQLAKVGPVDRQKFCQFRACKNPNPNPDPMPQ